MKYREQEFDVSYMKCAEAWAALSRAKRGKVGAIISNHGNIIGFGFNGTPTGFNNTCEVVKALKSIIGQEYAIPELETKPEVLHAESNAITKVAKSTQSSEGSTLYVTMSPCFACAKLIIQSGITRVVYRDLYRETDGINLLKMANIPVEQIEDY
jgi:dCMP deaminase